MWAGDRKQRIYNWWSELLFVKADKLSCMWCANYEMTTSKGSYIAEGIATVSPASPVPSRYIAERCHTF